MSCIEHVGMTDTVYYAKREAHYESFPAENYVDYMTNVMPVLEQHIFYIPSKGIGIVCEVSIAGDDRVLRWRIERLVEPPKNAQPVEIGEYLITPIIEELVEGQESIKCHICEKNLGKFLRFF